MRRRNWIGTLALLALVVGGSPAGAASPGVGSLDRAAASVFAERRTERWDASLCAARSAQAPTAVDEGRACVGPKSARKAFFLSLLLPGLGQRYLGQDRRSLLYLGAEAGVWMTVGAFWLQGSMREDRYREYAEIVAGADPDRDDDEYYRNVGLYNSSDTYNLLIRWEARALHPYDTDAQRAYYAENILPEDLAWSWPDEAAFDEYKHLRRRSKHAYRSAVNCIGLAVLNRLVSAIDAVTGVETALFARTATPRFTLRALPDGAEPVPCIELHRSF